MPWLREPVNKNHRARLDFMLMNLNPRRVDSLGKLHVCVDTACDQLCDFWDRETERHHAQRMDQAACTIERIWYRAKALQRIEWMRNNSKMMREKSVLDQIYRNVDVGGDGVHSFDEFETMFRCVDPNVTTRASLVHFNRVLADRRRKFALEAEEKLRMEQGDGKSEGDDADNAEDEDNDEDEDEDEDEQQHAWEQTASPKQVMLFHTLHGNEALVDLKSSLVRKLVIGAEEKIYAPKEFLFHQGDEGDGMYVVEEGHVTVFKRDQESTKTDNSNYIEVAQIHMGSIVGESALLSKEPRNAALKSGSEGATCTFISCSLFDEIQYITGGKLGAKMVQNQQLISFDDWVQLIWRLGYEQKKINGKWTLKEVGGY
jgi:hypothetical protein